MSMPLSSSLLRIRVINGCRINDSIEFIVPIPRHWTDKRGQTGGSGEATVKLSTWTTRDQEIDMHVTVNHMIQID